MRAALPFLILVPIALVVWLALRGESGADAVQRADPDAAVSSKEPTELGGTANSEAQGTRENVAAESAEPEFDERTVAHEDAVHPRLRARAVDARTAEPIPDLPLEVIAGTPPEPRSFTTDSDGRFEVEELPLGASFLLYPLEGDYGHHVSFEHTGDEPVDLPLEIGPTYFLALDPMPPGYEATRFGALISDAVDHEYALNSGGQDAEPLRDGAPAWVRFSPSQINGDDADGPWFLDVISRDGFWHGVREVPRAIGITPEILEVRLEPRGVITGTVTNETGVSLRGFWVEFRRPGESLRVYGNSGVFSAHGLTPGTWTVQVSAANRAPVQRDVEVVAGESHPHAFIVPAPHPVGSIVGRVISRSGTFEGIGRVSLSGQDGAISNRLLPVEWSGPPDARAFAFSFDHVPEGTHRVQWFSGGMPYRVEPEFIDTAAPASGLEFVVYDDVPTADLWFEARDAATGAPLATFGAWWYSVGRSAQWERAIDIAKPVARGWPLDNETVWIVAADGYQPVRGDLADLALEDGKRVGRARLEPGWGIQFFVRDQSAEYAPLAGVVLTLDGDELHPTDARGTVFVTRAGRPARIGVATPGWKLTGGNLDPETGHFTDDIPWATGVDLTRTEDR